MAALAYSEFQNRPKLFVKLNDEIGLVITTLGYPLIVDMYDGMVSQRLINRGTWEQHVAATLSKIVKEGDKVIHLGGHIGFDDVLLGKAVGSEGKVFVFEPNPRSNKILRKNIKMNELEEVVKIYNYGAWSSNKKMKLCFNNANTGGATILENWHEVSECPDIEVVKIDDKLAEMVNNINLLFMDIEGAEIEAMKGLEKILAKSPHCIIIMEWYPKMMSGIGSDMREFYQKYTSAGYKFYNIVNILDLFVIYKRVDSNKLLDKDNDEIFNLLLIPPEMSAPSVF